MIRRCPAPLIAMAAALAVALGSQPRSSRADTLKTTPSFVAYDPSSMSSNDISQWTVNTGAQIKFDGVASAPKDAPSPWSSTPTTWLEYTLTTTKDIAAAGTAPPSDVSTNPPTPQVLALDNPISIVPSGGSSQPLYVVSDAPGSYYYQNPTQLIVSIGNTKLQDNGNPVEVQALGLSFYGQGLKAGESLTFELPFNQGIVGGGTSSIPTGSVGQQGGVTTPEPLSLLLWSTLAGVAVWRTRARARRSSFPTDAPGR